MLTQLAISAAKPKEKPYKLSDGGGLSLLVDTGGGKLWRFDTLTRRDLERRNSRHY
jgi:hypothetical protein